MLQNRQRKFPEEVIQGPRKLPVLLDQEGPRGKAKPNLRLVQEILQVGQDRQ
jgi:hypothetical protein